MGISRHRYDSPVCTRGPFLEPVIPLAVVYSTVSSHTLQGFVSLFPYKYSSSRSVPVEDTLDAGLLMRLVPCCATVTSWMSS